MRPCTQASKRDLRLARICLHCSVCKHARKSGRGIIFNLVKAIEHKLCPFCRAYKRVYGKMAHEKIQEV